MHDKRARREQKQLQERREEIEQLANAAKVMAQEKDDLRTKKHRDTEKNKKAWTEQNKMKDIYERIDVSFN